MPTETQPVTRSRDARSSRMSAEERRDVIIAAATHEFATGGLVGASTDAIAKAAGVSQPYVFQLFGTKKDLFRAVVRNVFGRTRLAFEDAVRRFEAGEPMACDGPLGAIAIAYSKLLEDRTLLLVQLQGYAACADPGVRETVRQEFTALHRRVQELSSASPEEMQTFFAQGMLMNVAAAVDFGKAPDKHWFQENLEGRA
jgi:AcrR family transcriptional regulator